MCYEHVWTSSNFTKICYTYWLHPGWFEVQQFGNLLCLHHQDRCVHTSTLMVDKGVRRHMHACTCAETQTHIMCLSPTFHAASLLVCCYQARWSHTLLEPKHGGTILHWNFINYSQSRGNLHQHHHENLKSHKIILDGCITKYRENHINLQLISIRLCWWYNALSTVTF